MIRTNKPENIKFEGLELLHYAIIEQSVKDLNGKINHPNSRRRNYFLLTEQDVLSAVDYLIYTLKMNGYSNHDIKVTFDKIVKDENRKLINDRLERKGIKL